MRTGFRYGVALLALLLTLGVASAATADETNPYDPPSAIIRPPVGHAAPQAPSRNGFIERFLSWFRAEILPRSS